MNDGRYRIELVPINEQISASVGGNVIARSSEIIRMKETRLPDCLYFPKKAIDKTRLVRSEFRTFCPFKGTATYWHYECNNRLNENVAWSYETPLPEAVDVKGMLSFSPNFVDEYDPPLRSHNNTQSQDHISSALSDWVLREAARYTNRSELIKGFAEKLLECGIEISRLNIILWSLHPEIAGSGFLWKKETGEVIKSQPNYDLFQNPRYINSPINLVTRGLGGVRQLLTGNTFEFEFGIFDELKEEGATDYVAMPLSFSDGQIHSMTLASDHPNGFTTANLGLVFECTGVIGRYLEVLTLRQNAISLMETYIGKRSGEKVLSGSIRRGQGENIQAVILFSDLRGSTTLAEALSRDDYLELLNTYFDTVIGPISEAGGEVLKFIGDAVLAIFPVSQEVSDQQEKSVAALEAAQKAVAQMNSLTQSNASSASFDLRISLHIGEVTYGNVGARDRLDFTVVGPAVNLASRIESLCKEHGHRILISQDFVKALGENAHVSTKFKCIGEQQFSGVNAAHKIYSLASLNSNPDN